MGDTNKSKDTRNKSEGMEEKVYMSEREMVEDKVYNGRMLAWITIPFGVIAEIIRVTVARLIFNKNERANLKEIFNRNLRGGPENEKKTNHENEKKEEKDENSQDKKTEVNREAQNKEQEKSVSLDDTVIQSVFKNFGINAKLNPGSDEIMLAKTIQVNGKEIEMKIGSITKEEILSGNANGLMKALHAHQEGDQYECALKALGVIAAHNLAMNKSFDNDTISEVSFQSQNGFDTIRLQNSKNIVDAVEVKCNGIYAGTITADTLINVDFESYKNIILESVETKVYRMLDIGKDNSLTLAATPNGMTVSYTQDGESKDLGCYKFENESDVRELSRIMKEENIDVTLTDENGKEVKMDVDAAAYVIGVISNPDMQPEKVGDEFRNTFSGEPEAAGKAHLELTRKDDLVQVSLFMPGQDVEQSHINLFEYSNSTLLSEQSIANMMLVTRESLDIANDNTYIDNNYQRNERLDIHPENTDVFSEPIISTEKSSDEQSIQQEAPVKNSDIQGNLNMESMIDDFILELDEENNNDYPISDQEKEILDAAMEYTMGSAYADGYVSDYPDGYDEYDDFDR